MSASTESQGKSAKSGLRIPGFAHLQQLGKKLRLEALGAAGVIEVGSSVRAVLGTQAEALKNEIKNVL